MNDLRPDPSAPLPLAPDPWVASEMPSPRAAAPYHMTEMIEAEPALAGRILDRLADPRGPAARLADAIRAASSSGRPVITVGCGTSEHGAIALAEILRDAQRTAGLPSALGLGGAAIAVQALEGALEPTLGGPAAVVIGVTHEGGTAATYRAMSAARDAGSTVAVITAAEGSPGGQFADIVIGTEEVDQSWCHTVGYLSPILAGAAIGAHLALWSVDGRTIHGLLAAGLSSASTTAIGGIAERLAGASEIILIGSGVDRFAARELVLKIEEGAQMPAAMRDLETMLHGHLAGTSRSTGLVVILADPSARGARTARALGLLRACRELGIAAGLIGSAVVAAEIDVDLTPAGRVLVPDAPDLPSSVAALVATTIPLQRLAEQLAIRRGLNPDAIRRDDPRYLAAVDAAE